MHNEASKAEYMSCKIFYNGFTNANQVLKSVNFTFDKFHPKGDDGAKHS